MEMIPTTDETTALPDEVADMDEAMARLDRNNERYKQLANDFALRVRQQARMAE